MISVEYNYVHSYGAGITNDYGGIKTGSKSKNCGVHPENCYTFIRLYNNLVRLADSSDQVSTFYF